MRIVPISPAETREAAYEEQMRRAYPLHPEVLRRFSGDWSVLDKFQRTRGVLKIMANAIYALWSGESTAPLITPALLPFRDNKVRTALLEPLDRALASDDDVDRRLSCAPRRYGDMKVSIFVAADTSNVEAARDGTVFHVLHPGSGFRPGS